LPWTTKLPSFGFDTTVALVTIVGADLAGALDLFTVELVEDFGRVDDLA
jgi:hypothetical protein